MQELDYPTNVLWSRRVTEVGNYLCLVVGWVIYTKGVSLSVHFTRVQLGRQKPVPFGRLSPRPHELYTRYLIHKSRFFVHKIAIYNDDLILGDQK